MKKRYPIESFSERLTYLLEKDTIDMATILEFDFLQLKEDIYVLCENQFKKNELSFKYNESLKNQLLSLQEILDGSINKVRKNLPVDHPLYLLNVTGGTRLTPEEKSVVRDHLKKEIATYVLMIEVVLGQIITMQKTEKKVVPLPKKAGRKKIVTNFKGERKLTDAQITSLYDLLLPRRQKEELFIQEVKARLQFHEIMKLEDVNSISEKEYQIKLGAENYMFAFVLTWLEKNRFFSSPFKTVGNAASFYSLDDTPLKYNTLSKAKSVYDIEKYITTSPPSKKPVSPPANPQDNPSYFGYLNFLLHETFK